jgi:hypothetical protein
MTEETMPTEASVMDDAQKTEVKQAAQESKFQEMLFKMMTRRWNITAIVLITFMMIVAGITLAVYNQTAIDGEWKELLLLMLGAFIGSYGKIIDYWFSDTDKDKMLVQKMDEEDGQSFSNTMGG